MNKVRFYQLTSAVLAVMLVASTASSPAFAANKDMIELQTKVQALLDAVARLQQSNDERMGVLKDLVQQNADSVNRMSMTVNALEKQIATAQAAQGAKSDQVSGQIQALNDSLDEVKARMNRLEKAMNDVSTNQQNLNQTIQNMPQQAAPAGATPVPTGTTPPGPQAAGGLAPTPGMPLSTYAASVNTPPPVAGTVRKGALAAPAMLPVDDMYKAAFNDFMAARYNVASAEFGDVIKNYPDSTLSGNAYYYLGEIDYRAARYSAAAKDYDKVLEQYPDNNKIPAAHLHKGQALIEMKQTEAGIRELRALIQRFPNSPEAGQARSKLNAMGVPIHPRA
jgi:tol-pal system protein YbgF